MNKYHDKRGRFARKGGVGGGLRGGGVGSTSANNVGASGGMSIDELVAGGHISKREATSLKKSSPAHAKFNVLEKGVIQRSNWTAAEFKGVHVPGAGATSRVPAPRVSGPRLAALMDRSAW